MSQTACGPNAQNITRLVEQTKNNYLKGNGDLGTTSELQAAIIMSRQGVQITDIVSCIGSDNIAAFFSFPERAMKLPSQCWPGDIQLVYSRPSNSNTGCGSPIANVRIMYGYRPGFETMSSYSSVFYIGGENPPSQLMTGAPAGSRLISDWTGIAFANLAYSDGILYYREPNGTDVTTFRITVYGNEEFKSRALDDNELNAVMQIQPNMLVQNNEGEQILTYIKSPFQDVGPSGKEFWWSPARFRIMEQIVQATHIKDVHKLRAMELADMINSRQPINLSFDHYSKTLAAATLFTGYNPELAIMRHIEEARVMLQEGIPNLRLLRDVHFQCTNNKPFLVIEMSPMNNSIIINLTNMLVQVVGSSGARGKTIIQPQIQ